MDAAKPFLTRQDLEKLSDEELVRLYCENRENDYPVSVLYARHGEAFRKRVIGLIRGNFRPPGWTPRDFADSVLSRALVYFAQRLCLFLEYSIPFPAFLSLLASSSVFDEYDYLKKFREVSDGSVGESDERRSDSESRSGAFRSRVLKERWWLESSFPHPESRAMAKERKFIVLRLLIFHALRSSQDLFSSQTIKLRYWDDWTLAQCGARLYGPPHSDREKNRVEQEIRRVCNHDLDTMRLLLKDRFGITALHQI